MKTNYRQKFYNIYIKDILPLFLSYEKKRKSIIYSTVFKMFILLLVFGFGVIQFLPLFKPEWSLIKYNPVLVQISPFFMLGAVIFLFILPGYSNKKFKKELKNLCMPSFRKCFKNFRLENPEDFDSSILEQCGLFSSFNRIHNDDIFTITHENVEIKVIETHLEDVQGSGKNRRTYNVFKGVVIIFPSNKEIKAHTIVATKGDKNIKNVRTGIVASTILCVIMFFISLYFNDLGNMIAFGIGSIISANMLFFNKFKPMQSIKLEDVEFDKRFCVWSENQLEARYLITPAFMDRFKSLQTDFGTQKMKCSFFEDKIAFAISTNRDLFEVGDLYTPLRNSKQMSVFFDELTSILQMVDYFKLDQNIGL